MPGVLGRVLVVDDSEVIRQLIAVNLDLEGFEVAQARDGEECLRLAPELRPDLITLDVVMPNLGGLATAARLRANPITRDVPIVLVSACTRADLARGTSVGVDAYVAKPFDPADLLATVRRVLGLPVVAGGTWPLAARRLGP